MSERLTCVLCPVGCRLEVARRDGDLEVSGNECAKGVDFAAQEILHPVRNLAASIPLRGTASRMVSVRLSAPVSRDLLLAILAEIAKLRPAAPVRRGQILIADVLGSGANVIATRTLKE